MEIFPERSLSQDRVQRNFFNNLINAGIRKGKNQLQVRLNDFFDEKNTIMRINNILSWYYQKWTPERLMQRQIEIVKFFAGKFPILTEKDSQINGDTEDIEQFLADECCFGELAEGVFLGSCHNILLDTNNELSNYYAMPSYELRFSFDGKVIWFDPNEIDRLSIEKMLNDYPEKTEVVMQNLKTPFIKLPTGVPIFKYIEMPPEAIKFIVDKRIAESAELFDVNLPDFQEVYNRAITTKSNQVIEDKYVFIPVVYPYVSNQKGNNDVTDVIIKPLFHIA